MANPFDQIANNSKESKNKTQWEGFTNESTVNTKTCEQCGAARPKNTNLTTCDYCGYKFMTISQEIKPDL